MNSRLFLMGTAGLLVTSLLSCTSMNQRGGVARNSGSGGAVYTGDGGDIQTDGQAEESNTYSTNSDNQPAGNEAVNTASSARAPSSNRDVTQGGVLIAFDIAGNRNMVPFLGCRLKLHNAESGKDYFVAVRKNEGSSYRELPPGRYFGTRLSCGTGSIWNLDGLFALGFQVYPSKVSYVGQVTFEFSTTDLVDFRHASRAASHRAFEMAQNTFSGSPEFVSGFTGRKLSVDQAASEDLEAFDIYAKGAAEPETMLQSLMSNLKNCANKESSRDPLRYGDLSYTAMYQKQKLQSLNKEDDQHALSQSLTDCVENSMRAFQPPLESDLEVRVRY